MQPSMNYDVDAESNSAMSTSSSSSLATGSSRNKRTRTKVPDELRVRTAVSCLECKSHKQKCTGKHPCDRCLKKGRECIIPRVQRFTGTVSESQRVENMEKLLNLVMPDLKLDRDSLEKRCISLQESTEKQVTALPVPCVSERDLFENAGTTNSLIAQVHEVISSEIDSPISDQLSPKSLGKNFTAIEETFDLLKLAVRRLPPKDTCKSILRSFFKVSGSNSYFYFEAKTFLAQVDNLYARNRQVQVEDANLVCLLLMSLAIGSLFETVLTQDFDRGKHLGYPGMSYYFGAKILSSVLLFEPSIEGAECFLMMGMYLLSAQQTEASYLVFGEALRACISIGLHKSATEENKRLFWSLYCIERKVAIALGRPETLALASIGIMLPEYHPTLDTSELMVHVSFISLATTISLLTFKIYDKWNAVLQNQIILTQQTILSMQSELDEWKQALPINIDIENLTGAERGYRGICHINFQYLLARIALGRPFLLLQLKRTTSEPTVADIITHLVNNCYESAIKIIVGINQMQKCKRTSVYSYMDYTSTHSSCIVILAMMLLSPSDQGMAYLEEGLEFLKFTTKHNGPTAASTSLIISLKDAVEHSQTYLEWARKKERYTYNDSANGYQPEALLPIMGQPIPAVPELAVPLEPSTTAGMPIPVLEGGLDLIDERLYNLSTSDWFNSILADSSFSFIQDNSIESIMFPEKGLTI